MNKNPGPSPPSRETIAGRGRCLVSRFTPCPPPARLLERLFASLAGFDRRRALRRDGERRGDGAASNPQALWHARALRKGRAESRPRTDERTSSRASRSTTIRMWCSNPRSWKRSSWKAAARSSRRNLSTAPRSPRRRSRLCRTHGGWLSAPPEFHRLARRQAGQPSEGARSDEERRRSKTRRSRRLVARDPAHPSR